MAFHSSFQNEKKLKIDGVIKNLRGADLKKTPCIKGTSKGFITTVKDIHLSQDNHTRKNNTGIRYETLRSDFYQQ